MSNLIYNTVAHLAMMHVIVRVLGFSHRPLI